MQYPSTGEAMRRKLELHASEGVAGNASAFRAINDYSHVTSIVRAETDRKWSGLSSKAARSPLSLVPLFLSHHFRKEVPFKKYYIGLSMECRFLTETIKKRSDSCTHEVTHTHTDTHPCFAVFVGNFIDIIHNRLPPSTLTNLLALT